mmetsp:Transcript_32803/g.69205  ORF Transcript_32803/g.69205 Transcript_32803/m.69205 type:complete len:217 (+) Transcript_32803:306-956(+)
MMLAVQHIIQLNKPRVQILNQRRRIRRHGLGIKVQLDIHIHAGVLLAPITLPLGLFVRRELMVFDKGVTSIELLEFGKEAGGNVSGSLEGAEEGLDGFLPGLDVLASGGGEDLAGGSEAFVGVDFGDDVEGFGHDEVVFGKGKNGSNLLPHQPRGSGNIIIGQKMHQMLDVLDTQGETNANAEGTVIVDVQDGELFAYHAWTLGKRRSLRSRRHGQ